MTIELPADSDVRMDMGALRAALGRRWLRIILVTVLLLGGAYAVLLFVPKSYESTASILVENRDSAYTRPAGDNSTAATLSPDDLSSLISSQIELVKSRDTLLAVVRTQNLVQVPEFNGTASSPFAFITRLLHKSTAATPEDIAVDTLADHITVIRERDSALINVLVRSTDAELAAKLANSIAEADVSRRAGLSLSDTADASQWLEQQITAMRQRVADAENKVANFKVDNDLYTGTNSTSLLDQQLTEISSQITAAQERQNTAQSRSTLIRGLLAAGQPIDGVDDVRNSVTIQQLMQQKAQLTSQRAQLLATLLPTHPSVLSVTAQISAIDKQITAEGRRVADALDSEAKIEQTVQASLTANLESMKGKAASATKQGVTLDALNREATADRDLLESYMTRYRDAASRTDASSALPDVRVVTYAAPANAPASPKTPLILGAVAFVSLAVQIGGVLFGELLSGRALTEPGREEVVPRRVREPVEPIARTPEPVLPAAPLAVDGYAEPASSEPEMADEALSEEAEQAYDDLDPPVRRSAGSALRSWFSKRAHAVGPALTAYEPPLAGDLTEATRPAFDDEHEQVSVAETEASSFVAGPQSEAPLADNDQPAHNLADADSAEQLANLSADLILGRTRVVMLAALDSHHDSEVLAERLIADVLHRGLSVARVDAGSGRPSTEPGLTDLAAERASFGDVVHKRAEEGMAEVPWGHLTTMDRRSTRPVTLVEALSDIYEVVVILSGRVGMASSLPVFAGLPCRLVLVAAGGSDPARVEAARADVTGLGYESVEVITAPAWQAQVA